MTKTTIRRAGPADAETLSALGRTTFTQTFGHLYPEQDLLAFLDEGHSLAAAARNLADPALAIWLAESEGDGVGYAMAGPCGLPHPDVTPNCGELKRVYVLPRHHGEGLGTRLMEEAFAWLKSEGRATLWIGVWSKNLAAQRLYGRHSFEKVGEYGFRVGATIDQEFILRRG